MKYLYLALSSIILAYMIIVLFTYLYQRKLLYHPSENNYTGDEIQFEYKEVFIEVDKGIKLRSWFLKKELKKDKTILYFFKSFSKNHDLSFISLSTSIKTSLYSN